MNPNPTLIADTLVGKFIIKGCEERLIWYNPNENYYYVTDKNKMQPNELSYNKFENKCMIIDYYKCFNCEIAIGDCDTVYKPNMITNC